MINVGLKYTHDAAVALVDDEGNRLIACHEVEKIGNNPRHSEMIDANIIDVVLEEEGYSESDVGTFFVDGWKNGNVVRGKVTMGPPVVGDYMGSHVRRNSGDLSPRLRNVSYESGSHEINHVVGSYAMSPYSSLEEDAYVLVWDGGMPAKLFAFRGGKPYFVDVIFDLSVSMYADMGLYFGPYKVEDPESHRWGDMSWPGKLMSLVGLGKPSDQVVRELSAAFDAEPIFPPHMTRRSEKERNILRTIAAKVEEDDVVVLSSIHHWMGAMLTHNLEQRLLTLPKLPLIFTGGAALNIKWNSALLAMGLEVWIPPCPNDSGSAIWAACPLEEQLEWDVFSGPRFIVDAPGRGWRNDGHSSPEEVAAYLAENPSKPVLSLRGRAELGPRALGNRSILASPILPSMGSKLNEIKRREPWRPVAPVTTESRVGEFFIQRFPDPYMLFERYVRPEKRNVIESVIHVDGTARCQTTTSGHLHETIVAFAAMTGVPVLCNTSANLPGRGFFPDLSTAARWARDVGIEVIFTDDGAFVDQTARGDR